MPADSRPPSEKYRIPDVKPEPDECDALGPHRAFQEVFEDDDAELVCNIIRELFDERPPVVRPEFDGRLKLLLWLPALAPFADGGEPKWSSDLSALLLNYVLATPLELPAVIAELERIVAVLKSESFTP